MSSWVEERLTEFERELLQTCVTGQPTTFICDMLDSQRDREAVEATLRGLASRGLVTSEHDPWGPTREELVKSGKTDLPEYVTLEDDWWDLTPAGRVAIGLPALKVFTYSPPARHFATLEEAALEGLPDGVARVVTVAYSPDGRDAVALLALNEPDDPRLCEVVLALDHRGWAWTGQARGEPSWASAGPDGQHVATAWGEALPGAQVAILEFEGAEYETPVIDGYYLLAVWNLPVWGPDDEPDWNDPSSTPTLLRFIPEPA